MASTGAAAAPQERGGPPRATVPAGALTLIYLANCPLRTNVESSGPTMNAFWFACVVGFSHGMGGSGGRTLSSMSSGGGGAGVSATEQLRCRSCCVLRKRSIGG